MSPSRRRGLILLVCLAAAPGASTRGQGTSIHTVLVDDFTPRPVPAPCAGSAPFRWFNRLGGERGELEPDAATATHAWGGGTVRVTLAQAGYGGVHTSLSHRYGDATPLDFAAVFPAQVVASRQGRVSALRVEVRDGGGSFTAELKNPDGSNAWTATVTLQGGAQGLGFPLPALGAIRGLNWFVSGPAGGFVEVDQVTLEVEVPDLAPASRAFLWSYAALLANWTPATGLTRDRAHCPAGSFENVSASGMQAAAAAVAWRAGIVSLPAAQDIVTRTAQALLSLDNPACGGILPHFTIGGAPAGEWSSLDTVIAWVAVIEAQQALGLPTSAAEQAFGAIDWPGLVLPSGRLSHGYALADCATPLAADWSDFGTESWLANFGYAAGAGQVAQMTATPPTRNGSGFIDELSWLLLPVPWQDRWGIGWAAYRAAAAQRQANYYAAHACHGPRGLFGLSAAEVPDPAAVSPATVYRPFGVGGLDPPHDAVDGRKVVVPHEAGLVASLRLGEAAAMWASLEGMGLLSPLNHVESLLFEDEPACGSVVWNDMKGSWNLALQALGWGRALLGPDDPLPLAASANAMLTAGYALVAPVIFRDGFEAAGMGRP
jgi:hypothetical protein